MSEKIKAHVAEFKVTKQSVVVEIPVHIARKMLDGRAAINSHTLELANAIELALVEFEENERKNEWVDPDFPPPTVNADDLRALLDAHAAALDALVGALHVLRESDAADVWEEETDAVKAALAKAGRR